MSNDPTKQTITPAETPAIEEQQPPTEPLVEVLETEDLDDVAGGMKSNNGACPNWKC
jgi:hypothetical protein